VRIWKTFSVLVLLAGAAVMPSVTNAQNADPMKIGVVDIKYIFDNHPTLKSKIEQVDAEIRAEEESINKRRETILKDLEKLRDYKEDTAEYRAQEEKIAGAESELKLEFVRKEKDFARAKAKIILDTYKEIQGNVKMLADYHKISVVLRYSKDEMDAEKPASVTQGIARDLVYFSESVDMTNSILTLMKRNMASNNGQQAPAAR
jgi:Skp family chaperone for outer membrane proteins